MFRELFGVLFFTWHEGNRYVHVASSHRFQISNLDI